MVDTDGIITTIAGNGIDGISGDGGPAAQAQLNDPHGVALDNAGNIYIADRDNNRIRKVDPSGIITTIAGTGTSGYMGEGGPATQAQLDDPWAIAVDNDGSLYIADYYNNCIRKVDPSGVITTIAGTGTSGDSGDGGPAALAQLYRPRGVTLDPDGNIYISDAYNHRVRKLAPADLGTEIPTGTGGSIYIEAGSITDSGTIARIEANGGGPGIRKETIPGAAEGWSCVMNKTPTSTGIISSPMAGPPRQLRPNWEEREQFTSNMEMKRNS